MERMFGPAHPDCPPLPEYSRQAVGVEVAKSTNINRYDENQELLWKSRQPLAEKPQGNNTKKKKQPEKELEVNDLVFAREFVDDAIGRSGLMWPSVLKVIHRYESGAPSGYGVEYLGHYSKEKGNLDKKFVKAVNNKSMNKWGSPCFNRKSKVLRDSFGTAMRRLIEEGLERGMNLRLPSEESDEDKEN